MKRRLAVQYVASIMGLAISAPTLSALNYFSEEWPCKKGVNLSFLSGAQFNLLEELTELIIPKTNTPGAKEAQVAAFIDLVLEDCYQEKEKNVFTAGLQQLQNLNFSSLPTTEQIRILQSMERESLNNRKVSGKTDFWLMLKELTLLGYFGSEIGIKSCFDYRPVPGKLENVKWEEGMKMIVY